MIAKLAINENELLVFIISWLLISHTANRILHSDRLENWSTEKFIKKAPIASTILVTQKCDRGKQWIIDYFQLCVVVSFRIFVTLKKKRVWIPSRRTRVCFACVRRPNNRLFFKTQI